MSPTKVILHFDLDAFFAAVEQRDNPQLRGKPVIVGADPQKGEGRGVVSTCSYEARKFGVRSAMPISQAYRLCPHGIFVPPNFDKYSAASQQIFKIAEELTPHIQKISIDEAFLDITTSFHLFGTPIQAAQKLKADIKQKTGLTASVGIASVKFVAKIASDFSKPDGLLEITEDKVLEFLRPLPVRRLWGVGPKTEESLKQMGVNTIGEIAAMGLQKLQELFGEHGEHLYDLAIGNDDREVVEDEDIKSVSHEHTFDTDTKDKNAVISIMLELAEQVSRRLRKYGLKGKTVTVKVRLKGFQTYTRAVTLSQRTNFGDVIFQTANDIFEKFYKNGMQVRLIGVRVTGFEDAYVQENLFTSPQDVRREKVHMVLDKIRDKFGEDAIGRGIS